MRAMMVVHFRAYGRAKFMAVGEKGEGAIPPGGDERSVTRQRRGELCLHIIGYWMPHLGPESICDDMRIDSIPPTLDLHTTATLVAYSSASSKAFKIRTTAPAPSRTSLRSGSLRTSRVHLSNRSG